MPASRSVAQSSAHKARRRSPARETDQCYPAVSFMVVQLVSTVRFQMQGGVLTAQTRRGAVHCS